jgi:hypothetical protein
LNVIPWLFWPSLVALVYFGGCWVIARFWEPGALAVMSLGDMAPARPRLEPLKPSAFPRRRLNSFFRPFSFEIVDEPAETLSGIARYEGAPAWSRLEYPKDGC